MNKGFSKLDNSSHEGATNTWLTPLELVRAVGPFDLDPCAYPGHKTATNLVCLPHCGLRMNWSGRVWLNPPYGRSINLWLSKLRDHGDGIALIFSRTDTKWFYDLRADATLFLRGRIKFLTPDLKAETNAGHGSMLVAFGLSNVNALFNSDLPGTIMRREGD